MVIDVVFVFDAIAFTGRWCGGLRYGAHGYMRVCDCLSVASDNNNLSPLQWYCRRRVIGGTLPGSRQRYEGLCSYDGFRGEEPHWHSH